MFHDSNLEIVKNILLNNCYPIELINRKIRERILTIKNNNITMKSQSKDVRVNGRNLLVLPYIKGISNGMKRALDNCVDVIYTIPKKLSHIIKKGKDKLDYKIEH